MASGRYRKARMALGSRTMRRAGTKREWIRQPKGPHKRVGRNPSPRSGIHAA